MSDFLKVIILAVLQGVAEFLPVSSSGHLVLAKSYLGLNSGGITLELVLHGGTLGAVLIYYRKRIAGLVRGIFCGDRHSLRYAGCILLSMIPAGAAYAMFSDIFERAYESTFCVSVCLIFTGCFLFSFRFWDAGKRSDAHIGWITSFIIGLAQCVAMLPGVSRSGSTIFVSRLLGISREEAAEFSLLMSVPVIAGALIVDVARRGVDGSIVNIPVWEYAVAAGVSCVVGCLSISLLVKSLKHGSFWYFGAYCIGIGLLTLI